MANLVREYKLRVDSSQTTKIDGSIQSAQFIRNRSLRYWMDNAKINKWALQRLCKQLASDPTCPWVKLLNSSARQVAADRAWTAIKNFYDKCKKKIKGKKGYPKFKYNVRSVEFKKSGWKLDPDCKAITFTDGNQIGRCRMAGVSRKRRNAPRLCEYPVKDIKRVRLIRKADGYYVQFVIHTSERKLLRQSTGQIHGIDVGLIDYYTDDTGRTIPNPRHLKKQEKRLTLLQRRHSRKGRIRNKKNQKGKTSYSKKINKTKNRAKARKAVAKQHLTITRQRKDFAIKQARQLIISNDITFYEKLKLVNLIQKSKYAKSICDASWGELFKWLKYFAQISDAKALAVDVPAPDSSNECSGCGKIKKKQLSERWHNCFNCGLSLPRDENSARVVKQRGLVKLGITGAAGQTGTSGSGPGNAQGLGTSASLVVASGMKSSEEKLRAFSSEKDLRIPRL